MIFKLALAALVSGIAIPALALQTLCLIDARASLVGAADATVSAVDNAGRSALGPFLSGLI